MRGRNTWAGVASGFFIGVGIGAALGVLFAPSSGEETREYLADTARDGMDRAILKGQKWSRRAHRTVNEVKEQLRDAAEVGERAYDEARSATSPS